MAFNGIRGNGTGKSFYPIDEDSDESEPLSEKQLTEMQSAMISKRIKECEAEIDEYRRKSQESNKWKWWVLGVGGTLIALGFVSSQFLVDSFVRSKDYDRVRTDHSIVHKTIEQKIQTFDQSLASIQIEQARESERTKLIDARIELLLKVSDTSARRNRNKQETREDIDEQEQLRLTIEQQQKRIEALENDPLVKQSIRNNPLLSNLNSD